MKNVGCHTYKSEKKSGEHPEKNLGRFYRVLPFKSFLRVQIKRANDNKKRALQNAFVMTEEFLKKKQSGGFYNFYIERILERFS